MPSREDRRREKELRRRERDDPRVAPNADQARVRPPVGIEARPKPPPVPPFLNPTDQLAAKVRDYQDEGFAVTRQTETAVGLAREDSFSVWKMFRGAILFYPQFYGAVPYDVVSLLIDQKRLHVWESSSRPGWRLTGAVGGGLGMFCLLSLRSVWSVLFEVVPVLALLHMVMPAVGGYGIWVLIGLLLQGATAKLITEMPHPVLPPERSRALDRTPRELYLAEILEAREAGYVVTDYTERRTEPRKANRRSEPGSGPEPYSGGWGLSLAHLYVLGQMESQTREAPGSTGSLWARTHRVVPWTTQAIIRLGEDDTIDFVERSDPVSPRARLFVVGLLALIVLDRVLV